MKHFIYLLIFILFANIQLFAQSENPDIQTFTVKNFSVKNNDSKIKISFDLILSNCLKNYFNNPYYIYVKLTDSVNNIVYKSTGGISVLADKSYGKKISEHKYLSFNIPYSSIDLPQGKHKLNVIFFAENDNKKFPDFFKKQIVINKPKTYYYYEQTFNINNYRVVGNINKYGVEGIKINFNCNFKFTKNQIKGIETDNNLGSYTFYVNLLNADNNNIDLFNLQKNKFKIDVFKTKEKYELFIPYNQINLAKGKYKITVVLNAKTSDNKYFFKKLAIDSTTIMQPKLYFLDFELNDCKILKKEYDVPSVIGQMFSSATSNTGLGYPDVYWCLKTGSITKFYSKTNKNELWAIPEKAKIIITENDPLYFSVMDYDITSPDDEIGTIKLKNKSGNLSKKYTSAHFGNITSADFEYKKTAFPDLKKSHIEVINGKYKNTSGLVCKLSYTVANLSVNSHIDVTPFVKYKNELYKVNYENIDKKTENTDNNTTKNTVKVFIPYVKIPTNSNIGFIISDKNSQYINYKITDKTNIKKPDITDIKAKIESVSEKFNSKTNTFGVFVKIKWELPEFYKTDISKIKSKIKLYNDNKIYIDTLINNIKDNNNICSLFIPYYKLKGLAGDTHINIKEQSFVKKTQVGKSDLQFLLKKPDLSEINIKKILIKLNSNEQLNNISVNIILDGKIVCSKKSKSSKNIVIDDLSKKIICSKNDKLFITINNTDKFDITKNIITKDFFAEELTKHKKLKIKQKNQYIKKIIIYIK